MTLARPVLLRVALLLLVTGCVPAINNLTPANLKFEPSIQSYKDPKFDSTTLKTFSVFPYSLINDKVQLSGDILEKQMLFALRNIFEELGYKFVELNHSPDILITLDASTPYKETYVPPQTVTIPHWVPGRTFTTYGTSTGSFNYNTYGSYSSYGWGNYSGSSTSTTYVPGYMTTQTYTRSGYMAGAYYPSLRVSVFDGKTLQNIWAGIGVGTSHNPDIRVSSQFLLQALLKEFPKCTFALENYPIPSGRLGFACQILTSDGNNYFPTITKIWTKSNAEKAGVKMYDMILAVDGISMRNKPLCDVIKFLSGDAGTKVSMTLWRVDKRTNVSMVRSQRKFLKESVGLEQHRVDEADRLKSFLLLYCHVYESKDIDKFATFFAHDALENNKPFHELVPKYRKNMEMIESLDYRIELVNYSFQASTGNIALQGKFSIRYLLHGGIWKEKSGNISMELAKRGISYLVKQLNYGD